MTETARLLEGQKVLVTGASSGIGAAVALALGRAGATVAVNSRSGTEDADGVVTQIRAAGGEAHGIAPGAIRTAINEGAWATPEAEEQLLKLIPYGRIGEPDDVARAAVWLASDEADDVTGTVRFVDGRMSLYPAFRDNG